MQSDSPRTAVRSPVLPWILLVLIIAGVRCQPAALSPVITPTWGKSGRSQA